MLPRRDMPAPVVSEPTTIHSRIKQAYVWTIAGSAVRYGVTFGLSLLLARLLTAEDYGLLGMMLVFTEFLVGIFDAGLSQAVVHFTEDDAEALPTYFTTSLLLGTTFTLVLFGAAPFIAALYHEPRLTLLLRVMSFTLLLGSIRCISAGILSRELRFRTLSYVEIGSAIASGLVSVGMALLGFGVWSLIAGSCLLTAIQTVAYAWYARPKFRFPLDRKVLLRIFRYSTPLVGSSLLFKFYENSDYLVVGKLLGPAALGFYALAFRLTMLMNDRVSAVINRVAFPSFANLKHQPEEVVAHWFTASKRVTLITFPVLAALAIAGEDFIRVVLRPQWLPALVPLRFLCVMAGVKILTNIIGQILAATGHPSLLFRFELISAISLPVSFFIGCKLGGILGVGIAWCTVFPLIRLAYLLAARSVLRFKLSDYLANLCQPAALTLTCAVAILPLHWLLPSGALRLCLSSLSWLVAGGCYCALNPELRKLLASGLAAASR